MENGLETVLLRIESMSTRIQTKAKAPSSPELSLTPLRAGPLKRKGVWSGTQGSTDEFAESCGKRLVSQPLLVQAKLTINQPSDRYEQEADRVADQVMRMPDLHVQRQVEPEEKEEEEKTLQTKPLNLQAQIRFLRGGGQPFDSASRAFFEPRFGYDFSQVRVRTDAQAAETARALNVRVFTIGRDIVLGAEQYVPGTSSEQRLLAHELTHVVQQKAAWPIAQRQNESMTVLQTPTKQTVQRAYVPRPKTARDERGLALCKKWLKRPRATALAIFRAFIRQAYPKSRVTTPTPPWGCLSKKRKNVVICMIENPLFRIASEDCEILITIDTTKPASYVDPKEISVLVDEIQTQYPLPGAPSWVRPTKSLLHSFNYRLNCFAGKVQWRKMPKGGRPPIKP